MIDSHCHLNALRYTEAIPDLEAAIAAAEQAGLKQLMSIGTTLEEQPGLEETSRRYPHIYYSVGVHPSEWEGEVPTVERLARLSTSDHCKALGETGLDYHYNEEDTWREQRRRFAIHMQAACQLDQPVIVHSRNAPADTLAILREEGVKDCGGVLHCFTEDYEFAKSVLDLGMMISFSGIVTFKNARTIQEVAARIPLERMLIETDSPYLAPVPKRGKPNFPHQVTYVADFLAELRGIDKQTLVEQTAVNTRALFRLPDVA